MVWKLKCECNDRYATDIKTWKLFVEVKDFLESELRSGIFKDVTIIPPLDFGKDAEGNQIWHYTQRLFRCNICGCLWALKYPDFPAHGHVWKFEDGILKKGEMT